METRPYRHPSSWQMPESRKNHHRHSSVNWNPVNLRGPESAHELEPGADETGGAPKKIAYGHGPPALQLNNP